MGIYGVSKKELIETLVECLDNIEGDFSSDDLSQALTFLHGYSPTSDSNKGREKVWRDKLKALYGEGR